MEEKENKFKSVPNVSASVITANNIAVDNFKSTGNSGEMDSYVCKICGLTFSSSDALNNHLHSLHVIKSKDCFSCGCDSCAKKFQTSALLINHLRREHTVHKLCSCGRCGKKFTRFYSVPTYHSSEPPSKIYCNLCAMELAKDKIVKVIKLENEDEENTLKSNTNVSKITPCNNDNVDYSEIVRNDDEMYFCQICQLGFPSSDAVNNHLHSSHVVTIFSCASCKKEFQTLEMLMVHLRRDHIVQKFNFCDKCGKKFTCDQSVPTHHGSNEPWKIHCGSCLKDRQDVKSDLVEVKNEEEIEENSSESNFDVSTYMIPSDTDVDGFSSDDSDDKMDSYLCQLCQIGFSSSDALDNHLCSLHVVKSHARRFSCGSCKKVFRILEDLINHLRCYHTVQNIHSCGQCGEKFPSCRSVPMHDKKKKPSKIYCGLCLQERANAKNKNLPVLKRNNEGIVASNFAKKHFKSEVQDLEPTAEELSSDQIIVNENNNGTSLDHRNLKRKKRKFTCNICSKIFLNKSTLFNHEKKHCGRNLKSPEVCKPESQNADSRVLKVGNEMNSEEYGSISCPAVSENIIPSNIDVDQLNTRTSDAEAGSYICQVCQREFSSFNTLDDHLRSLHVVKSGESCFSCDSCKRTFNTLALLINHLQRHHSVQKIICCGQCGGKLPSCHSVPTHDTTQDPSKIYCSVCIMERKYAEEKTVEVSKENNCGQDGGVHDAKFIQKHSESVVQSSEPTAKNFSSCHINSDEKNNTITSLNNSNTKRENGGFICGICSKRFWNKVDFLNHECKESGEKSDEKNNTITSLNNRNIKRKNGRFVCSICSKRFRIKADFLNHECKQSDEKSDEKDSTITCLNNRSTKHENGGFICGICSKRFRIKADFQNHECKQSGEKSDEKDNTITPLNNRNIKRENGRSICGICSKIFSIKADFLNHECKQSGENICEFCQENFKSLFALKRHILYNHSEKPYSCEVCKKGFAYPHLLRRHSLSHSVTEATYSCDICKRLFSNKYTLGTHRLKHDSKELHVCKTCGKEFLNMKTLSNHMHSHDLQNSKVCGQKLSGHTSPTKQVQESSSHHILEKKDNNATSFDNRNLKSKKKKFACCICLKKFRNRVTLLNHVQYYCGKDPHSCKVCGENISSEDSLKRHLKSHSVEKPHRCERCGRWFTQKLYLKAHQRKPCGLKLACGICAKEFLAKRNLLIHERTHTR